MANQNRKSKKVSIFPFDSWLEKDEENKKRRGSKIPSLKGCAKLCGVASAALKRMKEATGLTEDEIGKKQEEFDLKFEDGLITYEDFKRVSREAGIEDDEELEAFCDNVFRMFDINGDRVLTFEEFTFATSAKNFDDPAKKLAWLFDCVYDKDHCGKIDRRKMKDILLTLLRMEDFSPQEAHDLVESVFENKAGGGDGEMCREEFVDATYKNKVLCDILSATSDQERRHSLLGEDQVHSDFLTVRTDQKGRRKSMAF